MPAMKITPPYILAQEAFAVGLLTIVFGLIASAFVRTLGVFDSDTGDWNANHIMEAALFFTGAFIHLSLEFTGVNMWYVKSKQGLWL
jgi:hypothetical protein